MRPFFILLPVILAAPAIAEPLSVTFEKDSLGAYTDSAARLDFPARPGASAWYAMEQNGGANAAIARDSTHGKVLRLRYPAGCLGPNDSPVACAGQIKEPLPFAADTLWISYDVQFEPGFEFVRGGKLPGLCGGKCYTGGDRPATGDGWSARVMWRKDGRAVQYMYFVEQTSKYGDDFPWNLGGRIPQKRFIPGTWHRIVTCVALNSVSREGAGDRNGSVRTWMDGELVLNLDTLRLRDYASQKVDQFYLSTFHGGNTEEWSPSHDSYARFDNFIVSREPLPVNGGIRR